MENPRITVLVTAYNEEKDLPLCLDSIRSSDFPKERYELVVVDNNSTDKTAEIAERYGSRVVKETRQGNTFAVSAGMKAAKGEIIAMTDADSIVDRTWLSEIDKLFQDEKIVAATGTANILTRSKIFNWTSEFFYELFLNINFLIGKPHITGFNLIVRRSALEKVGGINEKFTMSPDIDLGLRVKKVGRVVFSNKLKVLTSFRRWEENPFKTLRTYLMGYIYTVWLRKPPPVAQNVVRD
jgi:cellulose synthase/poly-beta-1,6-N-acetylglucosamine synthase-like glycosyltransferase